MPPFDFFDPATEVKVVEGRLPHWSQHGVVCFITWRTWDSMPADVLAGWLAERNTWLRCHHIDPESADLAALVERLPSDLRHTFRQFVSNRWEETLDRCHGTCVLRRPDYARIVADSLLFFDSERYLMTDFVVMPNHVHLLVAFPDADRMCKQCESWKHYTAVRLNKLLRRTGRFWETESFDHLVRSEEQFDYLRQYIADNPSRSALKPGEFIHYSRPRTEPAAR
ncbi:MAG TPA: transposase [Fimbriiglobus sp.]|nr:transposase [Fimbriiglobus sp.]